MKQAQFKKRVVDAYEASEQARQWEEARKSINGEVTAHMTEERIKTVTIEVDDDQYLVTLVAPEPTAYVDEDALKAVLKKKGLPDTAAFDKVVTTTFVRNDDKIEDLIASGKLKASDVKLTTGAPRTPYTKITKK